VAINGPLHTGKKVEFNTVDFVEPATNRKQLSCRYVQLERIGNKYEHAIQQYEESNKNLAIAT